MIKTNKKSIAIIRVLTLVLIATLASSAEALSPHHVYQAQPTEEAPKDAASILCKARTILVNSRTGLVKSEVIESALQSRKDFQQSGLLITKDRSTADLTIEVRRSNFTTEYPYVVIDARTRLVVASGKVNSLFGTAAGKIAKGFMQQVEKAREKTGLKTKKN